MRRTVVAAVATAALAAITSVASGAPDRNGSCEAATRADSGRYVCVGNLPTSRTSVVLKSQNGSSERGIALVSLGLHETKVVIKLAGAPPGVKQPALIRLGGCLGKKILSRLGDVVDGKRVAKVGPIAHLSGFAIVVHASTAQGAPVVACGVVVHRHHRR